MAGGTISAVRRWWLSTAKWPVGVRGGILGALVLAYLGAFWLLPPQEFAELRPVNVLLVILAGLFLGMRQGLAFAGATVLLNIVLYAYDGVLMPTRLELFGNLLSSTMGLALCAVVGWGRDLSLALDAEVARREAAEQRRDELTALLVHDLKNPLTGIAGHAELLEEDLAGTPHAEAVEYIRTSTERMARMLLNLLDVNRAEDGLLRPTLVPLPLGPLVDEVRSVLRPHARDRNVTLELEVAEGAELHASVDAELMRRTLLNLVENALRYSPSKGVVRLELRPVEDEVELAVRDLGPGVPAGFEERIFEKYARVDGEQTVTGNANQGLGLHFCRLAVNAHGGRIWVEPNLPQGSVFRVRLRRAVTTPAWVPPPQRLSA